MDLLKHKDLIEMFGLSSKRTLNNWLYNGTLPRSVTVKVGNKVYFSKKAIDEWLEKKQREQKKKIK